MSKCIRIVADTQLAMNVPIRIMGARLVHTDETTADIYDEADSSKTAAKKRIALVTRFNADTVENLSNEAKLPVDGLLFTEGCYIDWAAGEVFLYVKE